MNIAREIGSLLSGFLAAQASTPTKRVGKSLPDGSRTTARENQSKRAPAQGAAVADRVSLSRASKDLLAQAGAENHKETTEVAADGSVYGKPLALPYNPAPPMSNPPDSLGDSGRVATITESPATRELVRATYGSIDPSSGTPLPPRSGRVDLRA